MMHWSFKHLFEPHGKTLAPATGGDPVDAKSPLPDPEHIDIPWHAPFDVDGAYYKWIFGVSDEQGMQISDGERRLLARIAQVLESSDLKFVPRMPHVVPQLLHSLDGEHGSIANLARQLSADPVLVAGVIRRANSTAHHIGDAITSIDHAIAIVGEEGLREIISLAAFRPIINIQSGKHTKIAAPHIWEQTKISATLCRSLDRINAGDPFRGYLAGLLPSIGLITVLRVLDLAEAEFSQPRSASFASLASMHARALSARITRLWQLPGAVIQAAECLSATGHDLPDPGLGRALYVGDQLSKARVMINAKYVEDGYDSIVDGLDPHTTELYRECGYVSY